MGLLPIQNLASRPLGKLSSEERSLWILTMEHRNRVDSLHAALGDLQANFRSPNPKTDDDADYQAQGEWARADEELRQEIIQEDQCFHLPIGHEFGEQEEVEGKRPRKLAHWFDAPGVMGNG